MILPASISFGYAEPGLVLAGGVFYALGESPPPPLIERLAQGGLPLRRSELAPVLQRLLARYPHLHERVAARTRHHRVTPLLLVDLWEDEWLELGLLAHDAPAGTEPEALREHASRVFAWSPESGWQRWPSGDEVPTETRAPAAETAGDGPDFWFEGPDPSDVAPAVAWLADLGAAARASQTRRPNEGPPSSGVRLRATAKNLEAFALAFEQRPEPLSVFATPRARRLLDPDLRVVPRLTVAASGIDWFTVSAAWEAEGLALSDADLAQLRAATTRFVQARLGLGAARRVAEIDASARRARRSRDRDRRERRST